MGLVQYSDQGFFAPRKIAAAFRTASEEVARTALIARLRLEIEKLKRTSMAAAQSAKPVFSSRWNYRPGGPYRRQILVCAVRGSRTRQGPRGIYYRGKVRTVDDPPRIVCDSLDCVRFQLCAHRASLYKKRREIGEAHR